MPTNALVLAQSPTVVKDQALALAPTESSPDFGSSGAKRADEAQRRSQFKGNESSFLSTREDRQRGVEARRQQKRLEKANERRMSGGLFGQFQQAFPEEEMSFQDNKGGKFDSIERGLQDVEDERMRQMQEVDKSLDESLDGIF